MLKVARIFKIAFFLCLNLFFFSDLMTAVASASDKPILRLYFVLPFDVETYIPITPDNIEEHGRTIWFMQEHPLISELLSILQSHPSSRQLSRKATRLKADFGTSGVFLIDRNGTILKQDTGATFRLLRKEMEQLEHRVLNFIGVVDVKAARSAKELK
jgi:hypothetical protein